MQSSSDAKLRPLGIAELADHPILTASQERVLARRIAAGDAAALAQLVTCNTRLVVREAMRYRIHTAGGPALEDLLQEGMIGLSRAARRFEPNRGFRFSTYATFSVKSQIAYAYRSQDSAIRLPEPLARARAKVEAADKTTVAAGQSRASDGDLSAQLGISESLVNEARGAPEVVTSLDTPLENGKDTLARYLGAHTVDTSEDGRHTAATDQDLALLAANKLDRRQQSEIAEIAGLSIHQVRRRIAAATKRLATPVKAAEEVVASPPSVALPPAAPRVVAGPSAAAIDAAYGAISERFQAVLGIYYESNGSIEAVAQRLEVSPKSASERFNRARAALRDQLGVRKLVNEPLVAERIGKCRDTLAGEIARLKPDYRAILSYRRLDGLTRAQAALKHGVCASVLKSREERATDMLERLRRVAPQIQSARSSSASRVL